MAIGLAVDMAEGSFRNLKVWQDAMVLVEHVCYRSYQLPASS